MKYLYIVSSFWKRSTFKSCQQRQSGKEGGGRPGEFSVREAKGKARRKKYQQGLMLQGVCGACELR